MAEKIRASVPGIASGFFAVTYYGTGGRAILAETLKAYSIENANERAERAMPPGAVTYEVTDDAAGGH